VSPQTEACAQNASHDTVCYIARYTCVTVCTEISTHLILFVNHTCRWHLFIAWRLCEAKEVISCEFLFVPDVLGLHFSLGRCVDNFRSELFSGLVRGVYVHELRLWNWDANLETNSHDPTQL
jgi:hypothetical protein